jgi:DNA-binding transcriptional ArsR family regulator
LTKKLSDKVIYVSRQWSRSDLIAQLRSEITGYFGAASDFDERVAKKFKLSRTDMRCLDLLGRLGPMTAGRLADESGLSTGAVTFLLDRLEAAGMVKRRRDTDDRRRVWVETSCGRPRRSSNARSPGSSPSKRGRPRAHEGGCGPVGCAFPALIGPRN